MPIRPFHPRRGNAAAAIESRLREIPRERAFQTPRIGEGVQDDTADAKYAVIRWYFDGVDRSEGEIVDAAGVRSMSPTLIWVDMESSAVPAYIGNVYHKLELVSLNLDRSGVTRDLYRATALIGPAFTDGAYNAPYVAEQNGLYVILCSSGDARITTTINGVVGHNQVGRKSRYVYTTETSPATGALWDIAVWPAALQVHNTAFFTSEEHSTEGAPWFVVPEWTQRSRSGGWNGGAPSLDWGEPFELSFSMTLYHSSGGIEQFSLLRGYGIGVYDSTARRIAVQASGHTTRNSAPVTQAAWNDSTTGILASSSPVTLAAMKDYASSTIGNCQLTFTENPTTRRLTAWGIQAGGLSGGFSLLSSALMIRGGRESSWPLI